MTEDYKKNVLNYITNNITTTSPDNSEIFKEIIETSKWESDGIILPEEGSVQYEGMIAPNELTSNLTILYGGWYYDGQSYGIITLVDTNFTPIKSIFKYDSGTNLRYIHCMEQAGDGTFYLVDDAFYPTTTSYNFRTSEKRFVMVNNFSVIDNVTNDYSITLRKSYIFANQYRDFYCRKMFKNPESAHYILLGCSMSPASSSTSQQFYVTSAIDLKISVESGNTWNMFQTADHNEYGGGYALFDSDDNVAFNVLLSNPIAGNYTINRWYKGYTWAQPTNTTIATLNHDALIDNLRFGNQSVFLGFNTAYFVSNNAKKSASSTLSRYLGLYKYDFNTSTLSTIYEEFLGTERSFTSNSICLAGNNGQLYIQYNNNVVVTDNVVADYSVQRLENDTWSPILVAEQQKYAPAYRNMYVQNNFNLLKIYLYSIRPTVAWYQVLIKEDYNPNNYNGNEYIDYNSVLPQKAEIYSNSSLVFARNISNSTLIDNQSNTTIVVPNSYLNNLDITNKNLISQTNSEMVEDTTITTKNIYETLYLNFVNTINVTNEDTNTNYPLAAAYVNTNINTGTQANVESSFIGKIKINKASETTYQSIYWTAIDDTHMQTSFTLLADELISTIDFISNDETTIYASIDASSMETGKTYNITQNLRIE